MPERSGLPSAVRGTGADRSGLPSGVRGIPGVLRLTHCAGKGVDNRKAKVVTAAAAQKSFTFIESLQCTQKKSEHQFQPKSNLVGARDRARDLARRWTDAFARKDEEVRYPEVCPVGDIEGFSTKQHFRLFRDWDGLEDRDIDLRQARTIQHSAAHASPGP